MSPTIATEHPASGFRRAWARLWGDPESRSVIIGVGGVLLIHVLIWLLAPKLMRVGGTVVRTPVTTRDFNIELAGDELPFLQPKPKQPDPARFVETNPDAPENTPDKTNNFAAQNQQVAQPKPTPDGKSDRPALEGKKDFESNQIVSGQLTRRMEPIESAPPPPPQEMQVAEQAQSAPRKEQVPLSGTEKIEGENESGVGSGLAKRLPRATSVPEHVEGVKEGQDTPAPPAQQVAINPRQPRPRPQLVQQTQARPAVLAENKLGTQNIGPVAIDARWSNYGVYLQRMIEAVQIHWEDLIRSLSASPVIGSSVSVKFVMDSSGKIAQIVQVESSANETATRACVSAITDRSPYGPWTDDMKAVLGDRQEMTFRFYYW